MSKGMDVRDYEIQQLRQIREQEIAEHNCRQAGGGAHGRRQAVPHVSQRIAGARRRGYVHSRDALSNTSHILSLSLSHSVSCSLHIQKQTCMNTHRHILAYMHTHILRYAGGERLAPEAWRPGTPGPPSVRARGPGGATPGSWGGATPAMARTPGLSSKGGTPGACAPGTRQPLAGAAQRYARAAETQGQPLGWTTPATWRPGTCIIFGHILPLCLFFSLSPSLSLSPSTPAPILSPRLFLSLSLSLSRPPRHTDDIYTGLGTPGPRDFTPGPGGTTPLYGATPGLYRPGATPGIGATPGLWRPGAALGMATPGTVGRTPGYGKTPGMGQTPGMGASAGGVAANPGGRQAMDATPRWAQGGGGTPGSWRPGTPGPGGTPLQGTAGGGGTPGWARAGGGTPGSWRPGTPGPGGTPLQGASGVCCICVCVFVRVYVCMYVDQI